MQNNIIRIVLVVALILLALLVAMQFTNEVEWNLADFTITGVLLLGTGLAIVFTVGKLISPTYRVIASIIIVAVLLLIWAELAVGLFSTPWAGS